MGKSKTRIADHIQRECSEILSLTIDRKGIYTLNTLQMNLCSDSCQQK